MKKQYYFENEDAEICYGKEHFLDAMKSDGVKEMEVLQAIPDFRNKDTVWCIYVGATVERDDCKKSNCTEWTKGKGNVCDHRGKLYSHGDVVKLQID